MRDATKCLSIRAAFVYPVVTAPQCNAVIHIVDGNVAAIEPFTGQSDVVDWGDVAILPAAVNAHTHLEFSRLDRPLPLVESAAADAPSPPKSSGSHRLGEFTEWVSRVLAYRAERDRNIDGADRSVMWGIERSRGSAVAAVGEIATHALLSNLPEPSQLGGVEFLELMGLSQTRIAEAQSRGTTYLQMSKSQATRLRRGLSPHAPYTAAKQLVAWCARESALRGVPVAMHLAETHDELQLLRDGTGPLRETLERRGVYAADAFSPDCSPGDYLRLLQSAHRVLVIHGNYLSSDDWGFLAEHARRMSVVYCPRTHAYFGHDRYPLAQMIARGCHVAVGTDSLASNPDLDVWEELRFVAAEHADVDPKRVLELGTIAAAQALGISDQFGTIQPGAVAEFAVFSVGARHRIGAYEELLTAEKRVLANNSDDV